MQFVSELFGDGRTFPMKYSKDGRNVSPPLRWTDLPEGTRELAVIFENVTPGTQEPFLQWLAYKIPAGGDGLPEGLKHARDPKAPVDVLQGKNSLGNVGYDGPLGTAGKPLRYRFRLLALDRPLDVSAGLDEAEFLKVAAPHVIGEAELDTIYERPAAE